MSHSEMEILLHEAKAAIKCATVILEEDGDHNKFKEYVERAVSKLGKLQKEL